MTAKENSGAAKLPMRRGGKAARIAVIPGDGIGKEVTPEAVKVLRAVAAAGKRALEFVEFDWGRTKTRAGARPPPPAPSRILLVASTPFLSSPPAAPRVPPTHPP